MNTVTLLKELRSSFGKIKDPRRKNCSYALEDNLMTAVAMFHLKDASLSAFREQFGVRMDNLARVYGLEHLPGDTALRECLDGLATESLKDCFVKLHEQPNVRYYGFSLNN